jgi:hypothetical protein
MARFRPESHRFAVGGIYVAVVSVSGCASEPSVPEPELPCDVATVLESACQPCHTSPPKNGAPMPLLTFADTHAPFTLLPTYNQTPVWQVMGDTLESGFMPQPWPDVTPLSSEGRALLLDWIAGRAPAGTGCP